MTSMLIDFTNVEDYIPQCAPFQMIDRCVINNDQFFEGFYTITKDNPLVDGDVSSNSILIESFAQTFACGFGYLAKGQEVDPGFIGSISKLEIYKNLKIGDLVHSKVYVKTKFENIQLIYGELYVDGELIMDCNMKLVES